MFCWALALQVIGLSPSSGADDPARVPIPLKDDSPVYIFLDSTTDLDAIRKKLGDPRWIETVRGVGFRLAEPG